MFLLDTVGGFLLTKIYRYCFLGILIVYLILLFITPFNGCLYEIDTNNIYSRGRYFNLTLVLQVFLYITLFVFLIKNRTIVKVKRLRSFVLFVFFPQIFQVIQLSCNGIELISVGYTFGFIVIFIDMNMNLERVLDKSFEIVKNKDAQIIQVQNHTIISLSSLVEERDTDTGGHVKRTSEYVELLASLLMREGLYTNIINEKFIMQLERAAPMHDIGKIVVPDNVLKKPGRLSDDEFFLMKKHALEGGRIILEVLDEYEEKDYVKITTDIATYHHEKWNGTGYPKGLKGEEIPLSARIMAIADVFDALISPRVYKQPMTYDEAFAEIEKGAGVHFDPVIARVFLENKDKMIAINENYLQSVAFNAEEDELEVLEELDELA